MNLDRSSVGRFARELATDLLPFPDVRAPAKKAVVRLKLQMEAGHYTVWANFSAASF